MSSSSSFEMNPADQKVIKALPGNTTCADCDTPRPTWASVTHGILLCIEHSGVHRSLGTHISFVRSLEMDSWSDQQIQAMKLGGNDKCNEYLQQHGIDVKGDVRKKYSSKQAQLYKEILKARVENRPEPTCLPEEANTTKADKGRKKMEGLGSSPPPTNKKWWAKRPTKIVVGGVAAVVAIVLCVKKR